MKRFKKTFALFAAAIFCMLSFFGSSLSVKAEGPVTYYLKYVDSINEWRFQTGSWDPNGYHRELYYMYLDIKDGDTIAIDGFQKLDLTVNVNLNNVTIVNGTNIVVTANSIKEVYVINGSTCAINGNVTNATVYSNSVVNFNNNVGTLNIREEKLDLLHATVAVVGTVDHLYAAGMNYKHYEFYNFEAGSLFIENGALKSDASKYSATPSAETTTPSAPATPSTPGNAGEYDDVPKTADTRFNPLWLVGMAILCMAGAYRLNKEK